MTRRIDTVAVFQRYGIFLKMLGLATERSKYSYLYGIYNVLVTVCFTFFYPVHLIIGILQSETEYEVFTNLSITLAITTCTIKFIMYRFNYRKMQKVIDLFEQLDERVHHTDEIAYFRDVLLRKAHTIINFFVALYCAVCLSTPVTAVMGDERSLVYPAWIPFDYRASAFSFVCAVGYQSLGMCVQAVQNWVNDIYPPLSMCMLAGHIHMLTIRISKIGTDTSISPEKNYEELTACIKDYKRLMRIYDIIRDIFSWSVFVQFITNAFTLCIACVNVIFFANTLFDYISYISILLSIALELYPCCYYGSELELKLSDIKHAIYSCNWIDQQRAFRSNVTIFTEISLKVETPYAGGMVPINLNSYIASGKLAYSCFTLILSVK